LDSQLARNLPGSKSKLEKRKLDVSTSPLACSRRRNLRIARMVPMETLKNVLAMALPTITPVTTPVTALAAAPAPTAQPPQRASAGGAAKTETVIDVAAASASKVLLMVVSAYLG
jgi:hypothetical protein